VKAVEREAARRLRWEDGLAMREIADRLGVAVSSVSRWTRDITLTGEQEDQLRRSNRLVDAQRIGRDAMRRSARMKRLEAQGHGRALARQRDPLHVAGCMLFWAEGSKRRDAVVFTNSDTDMLEHFLKFLRTFYAVADDKIGFSLNCHLGNGLDLPDIERWWLRRLKLPDSCLRAHTVNRPSSAARRRRTTLPYGTARIVVCSTFIVQSIYGAIQEYAGFRRPEFLD
jgi:hypothetical protein